ncbi:mitochondrial rpoD precursor, putative [Plasmodium reichenowi]|uniref:Mitochondrial rpoD, putative n=1 Tax=Plasmodium reichenowi TaxID=5854 RepID=A0A060RUS8_PLARE|nr:mitochondrial rpoD precursor, putative [Plasmodium reichenowi]
MKYVLRGHKRNIQKTCEHSFKSYFSINHLCVGNLPTFVKLQEHNILFRKKEIYFLSTCKKELCKYDYTNESEKEGKKKNKLINLLNYHDDNKNILTKVCLVKNERDIINILQENIKNEKNILITPQNIVELLQAYSKYKYYNEKIIKLIILYMKYNMNKFSFIKLCLCLNYFVNLNIKNEPSFNNIISNIIMKKIKNDEYIDSYALCMVIKYLLKKKIDDINLIYMLVIITERKISEGLYNIYDVYNLILSFLNIHTSIINPGLYQNKQTKINNMNKNKNNNNNNNNNNNDIHLYGQEKNYYIKKSHNPVDRNISIFNDYQMNECIHLYKNDDTFRIYEDTKKINEENIYKMLHIYINFDNKNNNDIILLLHNLRNNLSQKYFTYKMYMSNDDKTKLYENLLKEIHFKKEIQPQYIALLLINVMKFINNSELSEELFLYTLKNVHTHIKEVVMNTKEHEINKYNQFCNDKKTKELFIFNNNMNTFCAEQKVCSQNSQNEVHIKKKDCFEKTLVFCYPIKKKKKNPYEENIKKNNNAEKKTRRHFNVQEIGLIFEFYTSMQNYIKERKKQIPHHVDGKFYDTLPLDMLKKNNIISHIEMYDNKGIVQSEDIFKDDVHMNKTIDTKNNLTTFGYHDRCYFMDQLIRYCDVLKLYTNILKNCVYLYSLYKKEEIKKKNFKYSGDNINIITYCKLFKNFLELYNTHNNFLDKKIFYSFFEEYFFLIEKKEKKLTLNEICDILKIIYTYKNTYVLESLLYNNKESKMLFIIQNNLIKYVTNEMDRIRNDNLYFVIMSFYYLSFLKFYNFITYSKLINFILRNVKNDVCIKHLPYVIIGIINFFKMYKKFKISKCKEKEEYKYDENLNQNDLYERDNNISMFNDRYNKELKEEEKKKKKKNVLMIPNNSSYSYNDNKIYRLHILFVLLNKNYNEYKIYYILNCIYMLIKLIKEKDFPTTYNYISKFHLLQIFKKLEKQMDINNNNIEEKYIDNLNIIEKEKLHIINVENNNIHMIYYNKYNYFINYVKYIYCISFLNSYIDLSHFISNIMKKKITNNFVSTFYTPFNSYLISNFLYNYEIIKKEKYDEIKKLFNCPNQNNVFKKYIYISSLKYIHIEKSTHFNKCIEYIKKCNFLNIYNIIYIIKTYKFLCYYINQYNILLLNNLILFLYIYQNIKMSSLYELLIEYIKFLYYLEYIQKLIFLKSNKAIIKVIIFLLKMLSKYNMNNFENNYIGMLHISLLYMSYFVKDFHSIFSFLSLNFLRHLNLILGMSMIKNLETYDHYYSFQIYIVNILKGVIKKKKRIMNEYNVENTPYTIDILIK